MNVAEQILQSRFSVSHDRRKKALNDDTATHNDHAVAPPPPLNGHLNGYHSHSGAHPKDRHSLPPSAIHMYNGHCKPPAPIVYRSHSPVANNRPPIPIAQSFSPPAYAPPPPAKRALQPHHSASPNMGRQLTYTAHNHNHNPHHKSQQFTFSGVHMQRGQSSPAPPHTSNHRPSSSPSPFRPHYVPLAHPHAQPLPQHEIEEHVNDVHIGSPHSPSSPRAPPPPPPNFPPPPDTLPLGWAKLPDGHGDIYYFNVITGEKQRQRPTQDATANIPGNRPLAIDDVGHAHAHAHAQNGDVDVMDGAEAAAAMSVAEIEYRKHNGSMVFAELVKQDAASSSHSRLQLVHQANWDLLVDAVHLNLDDDDDYEQVFKALRSIAENLFDEEQKYRVLYADNKKVQQRILMRVGGYEFLRGLGFRELSARKLICDAPDLDVLLTAITAVNAKMQALDGEKLRKQNRKKQNKSKVAPAAKVHEADDMDVDDYILVAADGGGDGGHASIRELSMDQVLSDAIKSPRKPSAGHAHAHALSQLVVDPELQPGSPSALQQELEQASVTYHDVDDQDEKQPVLPALHDMDTEVGYEVEGRKKTGGGAIDDEEDDEKVGIVYNAHSGEEPETDAGIIQTRAYLKNLNSEHDEKEREKPKENGNAHVRREKPKPKLRYKIIPKTQRHPLQRPIAATQNASDSDEISMHSISEMSREFAHQKQPHAKPPPPPPPPKTNINVRPRQRSSSTGSDRERAKSQSRSRGISRSTSKKKVASMDDIGYHYDPHHPHHNNHDHGNYARQRDISRDIAAVAHGDNVKGSSTADSNSQDDDDEEAAKHNHHHHHHHEDMPSPVVASTAYPYHIHNHNHNPPRVYYQTPPLLPRRPHPHMQHTHFSEDGGAHLQQKQQFVHASSSMVDLEQMDQMPPAMLKPVGILTADELKKYEKKWRKKEHKKKVGKRMSNFLSLLTHRTNPKYTTDELRQIAMERQQKRQKHHNNKNSDDDDDDEESDFDDFYAKFGSPIMTPNKLSPNLSSSAHPPPQHQQLSPLSLNTGVSDGSILRSVDIYFEDALKVSLHVNVNIAALRLVSLALAKRQWNAKMAPMYALSLKDEIIGHRIVFENDDPAVSMFADYVRQYNMVAPKFVVSYKA